MGLFGFGKKSAPQVTVNIPEIKLPTAEELFSSALSQAREISPLALGARETALADIGRGTEFFEEFQPTSFEEALAQQQFANIFPDVERQIKHGLSLSGIESSPILAQQLGRARGELGVDIGTVLANLGQQRATQSLQSRLGISPQAELAPMVQAGAQQAASQAQLQRQADLARAQVDLQNQLQEIQQQGAGIGNIGSLLGGGLGFALGGPAGAALGAGLGGAGSTFFGGTPPIDLGTSLNLSQLDFTKPKQQAGGVERVFGRTTNPFNLSTVGA